MSKYDAMNKTNLRAACKAAGITYGSMTVAEMRAALAARATTPAPVAAPSTPAPVAAAAAKPVVTKAPRVVQNGVAQPGPGKCLDVWNAMQALYEKTGNVPTSKDATDWATSAGANASNATQELSRWRKFAGLVKPAKTGKEAQAQAQAA
jgi:hypothetical protein